MGPIPGVGSKARGLIAKNQSRLKSQMLGEVGKLKGLAGSLGGGLNKAKNLLNGGFSMGGNVKEVAAKLANKSPFDVDLVSPTAHLGKENSKFNYGTLVYPQETQNLGDGHYIIFDIVPLDAAILADVAGDDMQGNKVAGNLGSGKATSLSFVGEGRRKGRTKDGRRVQVGKDGKPPSPRVLRKQSSGMQTKHHNTITDSIVMYTPASGNTFDYGVTYEDMSMGMLGNIKAFIDSIKDKNTSLMDAAGEGLGTLGRQLIEGAITTVLPGFSGLMTKTLGSAINPNQEMIFKSVPFRNFSFSFDMTPKNKQENDDCHKIINLFKFHMHPENTAIGRLAVPSEFQITYMYRDKENSYIPKISRCVCTTMKVDYSPESKFHTFKGDDKGAAPIMMKMDLGFTELEIMTKETIALGH